MIRFSLRIVWARLRGILRQKLTDKAVTNRVLEVLALIGTPASFPEVSRLVTNEPNYDIFARVTFYMMQIIGPAGRNYLLSLEAKKLVARSQQYLAKVLKDIESTSLETFKSALSRAPGEQHLSDAEVLQRLNAILKNFGVDDQTSPMVVLNSGPPDKILTDKLTAIVAVRCFDCLMKPSATSKLPTCF